MAMGVLHYVHSRKQESYIFFNMVDNKNYQSLAQRTFCFKNHPVTIFTMC